MKFEHYKTRNGSEIDIPIPTSYRDCLELLKSDYFRIYGRVDSLGVIWLKSFRDRALKHLFWLRFASYRGCFYPICKLRHEHYKLKYDCRVHAGSKIGYGLYLGHAMSMCVSIRCIIGNNVKIQENGFSFSIEGEILCEEQIAVFRQISEPEDEEEKSSMETGES